MQIFFQNWLWRSLKNGHLPLKLHSSAPLVVIKESFQNHLEIGVGKGKSCSWAKGRRGEERRGGGTGGVT